MSAQLALSVGSYVRYYPNPGEPMYVTAKITSHAIELLEGVFVRLSCAPFNLVPVSRLRPVEDPIEIDHIERFHELIGTEDNDNEV